MYMLFTFFYRKAKKVIEAKNVLNSISFRTMANHGSTATSFIISVVKTIDSLLR